MEKVKNNRHVSGFMEFLKGQGVIGLAIRLVIGTAAAALVNSLINCVLWPLKTKMPPPTHIRSLWGQPPPAPIDLAF